MTRNRQRRGAEPPRTSDERRPGAAKPRAAPQPAAEAGRARDRPRERREPDVARIYGFHSVEAALNAPRRELIRLYATAAAAERLKAAIDARGVETRIVGLEEVAGRLPRDSVHQGVLLEARPLAPIDVSELPARGLVLVLDQITDPHNVGAIFRTAAAFAVDAVVTTERHAPELSGALAKSASGGLEHVPICSVTNLSRALTEMGEMGYQRVGLDSEAPTTLDAIPLARPLALVLGAEDKGLRRLTRERCDALARLDLPGAIRSLNVSNAAAIALTLAWGKVGKA
ncbi:23S rRNA (guanosine2251-2'-O)-methyltransferase [Roseiarcus fermentans]|uniref:23S rRNA (Guanosine2251-2'-O)-methyltransferase n=1 Tax=Roseiarcus fermentans TaxID=1473586 RepID=A0A366EZI3_9HYPH|nr:23S rRNA (guanosine(2251)-2'-O)-methyltransferase RlmB [Roseiarcus fermentans]RBP07286.1 23S rRNA (guanosine2251-2'-O)-methyltransferase [Roseiarcus fermentans]